MTLATALGIPPHPFNPKLKACWHLYTQQAHACSRQPPPGTTGAAAHFFQSSLTAPVTPLPVRLSLSRPSSATLVPASAVHRVAPASNRTQSRRQHSGLLDLQHCLTWPDLTPCGLHTSLSTCR